MIDNLVWLDQQIRNLELECQIQELELQAKKYFQREVINYIG